VTFLNTGATIAVFQSDGIILWLMDAWNINVNAGVISLAVSFSRRPGILSGPVALCGFMDLPLVTVQPRPTYLTLSSRLFLHLKT
jgi:hypothetical protein